MDTYNGIIIRFFEISPFFIIHLWLRKRMKNHKNVRSRFKYGIGLTTSLIIRKESLAGRERDNSRIRASSDLKSIVLY